MADKITIPIDIPIEGLSEFEALVKQFKELRNNVNLSNNSVQKLVGTGNSLAKSFQKVYEAATQGVPTKEYETAYREAEKFTKQLDALTERRKELRASKPSVKSEEWDAYHESLLTVNGQINNAKDAIKGLKAQMKSLVADGRAVKEVNVDNLTNQVKEDSAYLKNIIINLNKKNAAEKQSQQQSQSSAQATTDSVNQAAAAFERLKEKLVQIEQEGQAINPIATNLEQMFQGLDGASQVTTREFERFLLALANSERNAGDFSKRLAEAKTEFEALKSSLPEAEAEQLSKEFQSLWNSAYVGANRVREQFSSLENDGVRYEDTVSDLTAKWKEFNDLLDKQRNVDYSELMQTGNRAKIEEYKETDKRLRELYTDLAKYIDLTKVNIDLSYRSKNSALGLAQAIDQYSKEMKVLRMAGSTVGESKEFDELRFKTALARQELNELDKQLTATLKGKSADPVKRSFNSLATTLRKSIVDGANKARQSISRLLSTMKKSVFNGLSNSLKGIAKNFHKSSSMSDNFNKSLKHGWTNIMKYVLGFRSMFFLVRKLRTMVKEGLDNLVQFEGGMNDTNKKITELQSYLLFLKNAWAAAFAPVINVIVPILNILIGKLADVGNAVARFFAQLTGQETVIQAVRTEVEDYAKSLDKSAGSSGKASKAADKLKDRLAAFDDLNVLGRDDTTDPNKGGGGGGSPDDAVASIDDMFERIATENSFADMIKEAMKDWDFTAVGNLLGTKLKEMLDNINWQSIQNKVGNVMKGITTFINGFFTTPGLFESAGYNLAQGFNTVILGLKDFFENVQWYEIFKGFGEGVRTFFENLDYDSIVGTFEAFKTAVFNALKGVFDGLELEDTLESLKTKWQDLNDSGFFESMGDSLAGVFASVLEYVNTNWSSVSEGLDMISTSVIGFVNGIFSNKKAFKESGILLANIANSIVDLGNAVTNKLKIHDAFSSISETLTSFLADVDFNDIFDLLNNIPNMIMDALDGIFDNSQGWNEVGENLGTHLANILMDGKLFDKISKSAGKLLNLVGSFLFNFLTSLIVGLGEGIWKTIKERADKVSSKLIEEMEGMSLAEKVIYLIKQAAGKILSVITGASIVSWLMDHFIVPAVSGLLEGTKHEFDVQGVVDILKEKIKEPFSKGYDAVKDFLITNLPKIPEKFKELKDKIVDKMSDLKDKLLQPIKDFKENAATVIEGVKTSLSEKFEAIKTALSNIWGGLWGTMRDGLNAVLKGLESFVNKVIDVINKLIGAFDIVGSISKALGITDNTSSPTTIPHVSIPRLAQGAVIPPNREFLAVLGDQKSGTNIEAPLDTIKQALSEVMSNLKLENTGTAVMEVDGQTFARLMTPYVVSELGRRGYDVTILEGV